MRRACAVTSAGYRIKRKRYIRKQIVKIIFLAIIVIVLGILCANQEDSTTVCYEENSTIDYRVYLKDNQFYDNNYVEKDNQYIASLINHIVADFNYELAIFEKNIEYDYKYKVEAEVKVSEKSTDKTIYKFKEELVEEKSFSHDSNYSAKINEQVNIDYNKYNNKIKKFVSVYELDNAVSTLTIKMLINIDGEQEKFARDKTDQYVVSLEIPLTTKTMAININSNLIGCEESLFKCETKKFDWLQIVVVLGIILELLFITKLVMYVINSRTPEDIYRLEVNKIFNNYGSYIQKVTKTFSMEKYDRIYLDTFNDMLEIRDTIQEPILVYEEEQEKITHFMIPTKTNILYVYQIKVNNEK